MPRTSRYLLPAGSPIQMLKVLLFITDMLTGKRPLGKLMFRWNNNIIIELK